MSQGNYVTDERIEKVQDEVWNDETVRYIARTTSKVKSKYQGSTTKFDHTKGWPRLVATDSRVFIKIPKIMGSDVESIDYEDLSAADLGSSGLSGTEIKLRTVRGKTYTFKADKPGDAELEEMVEFIREQISNQSSPEPDSTSTTSPSSSATTTTSAGDRADLHKTESCVECGKSVSEGVSRCPNCGFNPGDHKTWFYIHAVLAGIAGATIVGLVIVPFFIWKGRKHRKKYKSGVTG